MDISPATAYINVKKILNYINLGLGLGSSSVQGEAFSVDVIHDCLLSYYIYYIYMF